MVTFDSDDPGTSAGEWRQDPRWGSVPALTIAGVRHLVVLAAHPDDETLGAGGLIARAVEHGVEVTVVVVTDGSGDPSAPVGVRVPDAAVRAAEAEAAMAELGVVDLRLLGFRDGAVREERDDIAVAVHEILRSAGAAPDTLVVAPWPGDGHRDHRVLGEIVADVARRVGRRLWQYPIWMWHWATPSHPDVPWGTFAAVPLSRPETTAKGTALGRYVSQTEGERPMLHARFLQHFAHDVEVFVVAHGG
jgi:LmbE family N-acetylglucosaminyl deacetylase